jgi:hypothetical protein
VVWLANVPLLLVTQLIVLVAMIQHFFTVYRKERRGNWYTGSSLKNSKKVSLKCALYVLAVEITWFFNIWGTIEFWLHNEDGQNDPELTPWENEDWNFRYIANLALMGTSGVWSSIAYFVMPFMDVRKDHPEWGLFTQLKKTVLPTPKVGDAAMSN